MLTLQNSVETNQKPPEASPPPPLVSTTSSDKKASPPLISSSHNKNTITYKSKLPQLSNIPNHLPLHAYCFENLQKYQHKTCLILSSNKTYTYSQTHQISQKLASGLSNYGIKKGDTIMILLQNSAEFVFTFLAASMLNAVITTANPFYTAAEILKQVTASNTKIIITQSLYVHKLPETVNNVFTIDHPPPNCLHFSVLIDGEITEMPWVMEDSNDAVALPFSSGTTGLPKGVVLTHKSLITNVAQQVDGENPNLDLKEEDVVMCVLPLFHIYALNSVLLCSLRVGAAVLLMPKFEIGVFLEMIERHRVTVAPVVPPLVLAVAKNPVVAEFDLSSIRLVMSGAAPLGKELEEDLRRRVPRAIFAQGYGMTEAGPVLTMSLAFAKHPFPTKSGSCGTVVRNAELKIIDTETGSSLGYNQAGEICIRGDQIMKGYLNDNEATAATIDVDGWLHTGDVGFVDNDDEVFIVDRVKELIKFKGFQVPPAELESLLVSHPGIADAAVVPQKDDAAGEVPVAFVVLSNGFELTEETIKDMIAKQVVFYKKLHRVYFINSIPKSPSGKILRKDLRAKLASNSMP